MRHSIRFAGVVSACLAVALSTVPAGLQAQAQSRDIQVLVAPLKPGAGVSEKFGEKVADRVRKALEDFSGMRAVEKGDVKDALKQFNLDPAQMSLIEWRQLAGRLNAGLVMFGQAEMTPQGAVRVDVKFVDPSSGDELPVDEFTVADDGRNQEAADMIAAGLEQQVQYQRSVVFCSEYLGSEQYEDALNNCNRALAINPNSTRALYLRGRVFMEQEAWDQAVDDLRKVVAESPSNTDALQSLAYTYAQLGNTEESLRLYREYLTFQPDDAEVRLNVAFNLAQAGAFSEAVEILREGVERQPDHAGMWEYLGQVAMAAGTAPGEGAAPTGSSGQVSDTASVRLAVRAFDRVLELRGDSIQPQILTNAIAANLELGDLDAALDFSERALEAVRSGTGASAAASSGSGAEGAETPDVPGQEARSRDELLAQIHSYRADVFDERGDLRAAVSEMNEALSLVSDRPSWLMKRGWIQLRSGNTERALTDYRAAVEAGAGRNAIASQLLAAGYNDYAQRGRHVTAVSMFETALEFAEESEMQQQIHFFAAFSLYQLGAAIDQQNEQQEACQPARRALSYFQRVGPHLNRAGSIQASNQAQIREATDVQLYRQEQIIKKACGD